MRHRGAGRGEPVHRRLVEVHAVRQPDVLAEPAELVGVLGGRAARLLPAVGVFLTGLGQVGVHPHAELTGQLGRLAHEPGADRERRARRQGHLHHGAGGRVVEPAHRFGRRGQRGVRVLDDLGGRQPARRAAQVHRPPAGMEAQPDGRGRGDLGLERVPPPAPRVPAAPRREDVVVVGAGSAAGQGHPGQARGRRRMDLAGIDPDPHRVQLGEPVEQHGLLRPALGEPLVQVVMGVDQARRGQAAGAVHAPRPGQGLGRGRPVTHRGDPAAGHGDVAAAVLGSAVVVPRAVHGGDRAVLDQQRTV